jgi:hypothetical protein
VPGDARDRGIDVIEVSNFSRDHLGARDPRRSVGWLNIDALDRRIVRRNPSREVGQFRSKRRIDLNQFGSDLVPLD